MRFPKYGRHSDVPSKYAEGLTIYDESYTLQETNIFKIYRGDYNIFECFYSLFFCVLYSKFMRIIDELFTDYRPEYGVNLMSCPVLTIFPSYRLVALSKLWSFILLRVSGRKRKLKATPGPELYCTYDPNKQDVT